MSRWISLIAALGGVAILFGIASVLLFAMSGTAGIMWDLGWVWANFVAGILLLGTALVLGFDSLRERISSGEGRRVGKYGTSAVVSTILSVVIIAALGFFANRNSQRFDWTESGVHSLSDQTEKVLAGLERDVQVTALMPRANHMAVRPLLEKYAYASPHFVFELSDPNERPDLVERFGIEPERLGTGILHVSLGGESTVVSEPDESVLTNAIVKLTRTEQKKVYFLEGHNERVVDNTDKEGFQRAAQALENENYAWEKLLLAARGDVPEDADVVVVAGPTRPLLPQEHAALERYLEGGGALLVMIDPRANTDLYASLARWGVDVGNDVVVDYVQGLFGRAATPLAAEYPNHPINEGLREPSMFHMARSIRARPEARGQFSEIVRTGAQSWGEVDMEGFLAEGRAEQGADDVPGPVSLGIAGEPLLNGDRGGEDVAATPEASDTGARLVVYGDSDFASNQLIDAYRNLDLFVNSVNWLLGDVEAISIRPNTARASRFNPTNEQLSTIRYLSLFVLPELIAVLGVIAWWMRRRAPGR